MAAETVDSWAEPDQQQAGGRLCQLLRYATLLIAAMNIIILKWVSTNVTT